MRIPGMALIRPFRDRALSLLFAFTICHCAPSSSKLYVPDEIPEICREIDFRLDAGLRQVCGVETRNYMAYKNIPRHRSLLQPKGARIVQKGKDLELRLENTLPINLPEEFQDGIRFGEDVRRNFIASRMDYVEFFPDETASERIRIMRLDIPVEKGEIAVCYTVKPQFTTAQRKTGHAASLEILNCPDFEMLKQAHKAKMEADFVQEEL